MRIMVYSLLWGNAGFISSTVGVGVSGFRVSGFGFIVHPKKLETGLWTNSAGIPYALLLRIEAIGFPTCGHPL